MFINHGNYKGYDITEVRNVCWMIFKDGDRVNYNQEYFKDIYRVYEYIDEVLLK